MYVYVCVVVGVCDITIFCCASAMARIDSKAEAVNEKTVNIKRSALDMIHNINIAIELVLHMESKVKQREFSNLGSSASP